MVEYSGNHQGSLFFFLSKIGLLLVFTLSDIMISSFPFKPFFKWISRNVGIFKANTKKKSFQERCSVT